MQDTTQRKKNFDKYSMNIPWPKSEKLDKVEKTTESKKQSNQKPVNKKLKQVRENEAIDKHLSTLELTPHDKSQLYGCFDLEGYAVNQGSPELAAFMLDTYVSDIDQHIGQIIAASKTGDLSLIQSENQQLRLIAKILAAGQLIKICDDLHHAAESENAHLAIIFPILRCVQIRRQNDPTVFN